MAGATGTITKLAVRLNNFSHTFPEDMDFLLVGPGGQKAMIMSDVGTGVDAVGLNLTFEDGAPAPPATLVSGNYAPTDLLRRRDGRTRARRTLHISVVGVQWHQSQRHVEPLRR